MIRFYYILVLLFMFTSYLFPQSEEKKIIKVDTVVIVDTIIVVEVDTVTIEEIVVDTDYLPYLKETGSDTIFNGISRVGTDDPLAFKKGDRITIAVLGGGAAFTTKSSGGIGSVAVRVGNNFHAVIKYSATFDGKFNTLAFMLGYSIFKGRSILDISLGLPIRVKGDVTFDLVGGRVNRGLIISTKDITYYRRLSKRTMFSFTLGSFLIIPTSFTTGVGIIL